MIYEWLLLDADGTILDYDRAETIALGLALEGIGHACTDKHLAKYREYNQSLWAMYERGETTRDHLRTDRFRLLFEAFEIAVDPAAFNRRYLGHLSQRGDLLDGAKRTLEAYAGDARMALLTNGFDQVQRSRLASSGLASHFEVVITSDQAGAAKPDPRIFDAAFSAMGNPPKEGVLMVGDSAASDIQGGMAYGIDTCWINPEGKTSTLTTAPTYEIARLEELLSILPPAVLRSS